MNNPNDESAEPKPGLMSRIKQIVGGQPAALPPPSPWTVKTGDTGPLRPLPEDRPHPCQLVFQLISEKSQAIGTEVEGVVVIGRSDPKTTLVPDLDLAPYNAQEYGVSRRHAILLPTDEGLCVIDLDSTNGTWLNGTWLKPGQRYRLRSGDRVEFGSMKLVVRSVGEMEIGRGDDATVVTRRKPRDQWET